MTKQSAPHQIQGGVDKSLITLIVMVGIVLIVVAIETSRCNSDIGQAKQKTIQVCLQEGIDPECCQYPKTCEEHE